MNLLPEHLPDDYSFTDDITADEVIQLRTAGDWGTVTDPGIWQTVIDQSLATVGVRHDDSKLVGVGFLAGNIRHAVLCDFIVHPDHRGQKIGLALLHRRVNIADEMGIPYLYTELAPTNRLVNRYVALGFVATGHAYTRAARRHPAEQAAMGTTGTTTPIANPGRIRA